MRFVFYLHAWEIESVATCCCCGFYVIANDAIVVILFVVIIFVFVCNTAIFSSISRRLSTNFYSDLAAGMIWWFLIFNLKVIWHTNTHAHRYTHIHAQAYVWQCVLTWACWLAWKESRGNASVKRGTMSVLTSKWIFMPLAAEVYSILQ